MPDSPDLPPPYPAALGEPQHDRAVVGVLGTGPPSLELPRAVAAPAPDPFLGEHITPFRSSHCSATPNIALSMQDLPESFPGQLFAGCTPEYPPPPVTSARVSPFALEQPDPGNLVRHVHRTSLSLRVNTFTLSDSRLLTTSRATSTAEHAP
jgi:hypothetical protein